MTKGEIQLLADGSLSFGNDLESDRNMIENYIENKGLIKNDEDLQVLKPTFPESLGNEKQFDKNNNDCDVNSNSMVNYVSNLKSPRLKRQVTRILSSDDPGDIDIENIEHILYIAIHANAGNSLNCCEEALIAHLKPETQDFCLNLANKFNLSRLRHEALNYSHVQPTCPAAETNTFSTVIEVCSGNNRNNNCQNYVSLFTCNTCASNRAITVLVYDSGFHRKCYRDLKRGRKISKNFQCCCVQEDCDRDPLVFWSCGKSVYRYDPLLNKCKKRASLRCKRSKFNLVACGDRCFVIGGIYQIKKVLEIEEYIVGKKVSGSSWKTVARLPGDSLPINPSTVICNGLIYVFSAILDISGKEKQNSTAVYVFNPSFYTVKYLTEIPFSFSQMKTCAIDSNIYLASNRGQMIRFTPSNCSVTVLTEQGSKCDNFGMFPLGTSVILTGGSGNGKCNNTIRQFCTIAERWETLPYKLPDCMEINGACLIKIPNDASGIIPFKDDNLFGPR